MKDHDRPPGDRPTMKARKEMRTFARTFGRRDTPGSRTKQTFHLLPTLRDEPTTPTTIKMHVLEREPPAVNAADHDWRPLSDGVFATMVGRLCWTVIASAGLVGCAVMAAAWLFGRR